jgi:aminocarboxymuconate-semialdehyde decarboxylase
VIVDCHTHFLPADAVTAQSLTTPDVAYQVRIGDADDPDLFTGTGHAAGFALAQLVDPVRRMADMDVQGVDVQVLSVPPPFGFFHTQDLAVSRRLCARLNEATAAVVAAYPDRFIGLATVPIHHPEAAADVLEHAMGELGLRGAEIATRVGERNLDDPALRPFFAAAARLGAAIFVHSTRGLGAARLASYHFGNLLGNPTEDAIAAASLIFGGVLDAHPDLRIYVAHGGGSCPSLAGRWDRGWLVRPEARTHLSVPPSRYLRRMSFDSLTHGVEQLRFLLRVSDPAHVLLGTDYPYDMAEPDPVGRIDAAGLSDADRLRVLEANAAAMFGL